MTQPRFSVLVLLAAALLAFDLGVGDAAGDHGAGRSEIAAPRVLVPGWSIELIASEPQLVTPTGCCFDESGHLYVIECHTHFPPEDYAGPQSDRVYRYDAEAEGAPPTRQNLFYSGAEASMAIASLGDGWIGLLSRSELRRIRDRDQDGIAEETETLLRLRTETTYPHNGLASLTVGPDGWLYVGQGENFGERYELIGTDESKQIGSGEGGNVFRCRPDGSQVQRVATGFWNPFGLCFDSADRLWAVGNDPDSMPPNRLLHVVPTADFGFQFRFGRAGTHPLQAWNGELPGTLPMAASVGEAACDVEQHGSHLWVTSWGDNRIERHSLTQHGATYQGGTEVVVQGNGTFRPVAMATAPDGSIYVTDWVDRSYPVHRKGRLWRLSRIASEELENADATPPPAAYPELSQAEEWTRRLRIDAEMSPAVRLKSLNDDDPFVRQAAAAGLISSDQLSGVERQEGMAPRQLGALVSAWRWVDLTGTKGEAMPSIQDEWIDWAWTQSSDEILLPALRWATESGESRHLDSMKGLLQRAELSPQLFAAVIASIAYLETGSTSSSKRDPATEQRLIELIGDLQRPTMLRAMAVRALSSDAAEPSDVALSQWLIETNTRELSLEVVRLLAARETSSASTELAKLVENETLDIQTRADALASLSRWAGVYAATINRSSLPRQNEVLRSEAKRMLSRASYETPRSLPPKQDIEAWDILVGSGGNVDAGRRVFSRKTCVKCHAHRGRGASTGPDLTSLSGQMTSRRVLESILEPSKEISPMYVPWRILTVDGRVLTGLKVDAPGAGTSLRFQGADGDMFEVPLNEIEDQAPVQQSVMPAGLEQSMSLQELRDLIAFLTSNVSA